MKFERYPYGIMYSLYLCKKALKRFVDSGEIDKVIKKNNTTSGFAKVSKEEVKWLKQFKEYAKDKNVEDTPFVALYPMLSHCPHTLLAILSTMHYECEYTIDATLELKKVKVEKKNDK